MTIPTMGITWPVSTNSTVPTIITYSLGEERLENLLDVQYSDYPALISPLTKTQTSVFKQALQVWEQVTGVDFVLVGDSPLVQMRTGLSSIDGQGGTLGITTLWGSGRDITHIALAFDTSDMLSASYALTSPPPGTVSFYETALHEIGHVLSLNHSSVYNDLMYPYANRTVTLSNDDINAVVSLYGPPKTAPAVTLSQTATETVIQKCYIAYYGRPADPAGLAFWSERLATGNGDINTIIDAFANSTESQNLYSSLSNTGVVTTLYQQLFSREPESEGFLYWATALDNGTFTRQSVMLRVVDGAQSGDLAIINNKVMAAFMFTNSYISGYGAEDIQDVRTWLSDITTSQPYQEAVTAAIDAMGINLPPALLGTVAASYQQDMSLC